MNITTQVCVTGIVPDHMIRMKHKKPVTLSTMYSSSVTVVVKLLVQGGGGEILTGVHGEWLHVQNV